MVFYSHGKWLFVQIVEELISTMFQKIEFYKKYIKIHTRTLSLRNLSDNSTYLLDLHPRFLNNRPYDKILYMSTIKGILFERLKGE